MRHVTTALPIVYWLNLAEVSRALGIPRPAVRRLVSEGPLTACRFARGRLKVRSDALAAYEAAGEALHLAELRAFCRGEAP